MIIFICIWAIGVVLLWRRFGMRDNWINFFNFIWPISISAMILLALVAIFFSPRIRNSTREILDKQIAFEKAKKEYAKKLRELDDYYKEERRGK